MAKLRYFKQLVFNRSWSELLSRIVELTFGYLLYAISFLMPRNYKRWVFGTNVGFADNAKYLFIAATYESDIDACWIADSRQLAKTIRELGFHAAYKYSWKGLIYCMTAKYYVFTYHSKDINFFTSGGAKKINLWHGVGIKKGSKIVSKSMPLWLAHILLPHLFEKFDLFLSTSSLMNKHFQNMFDLSDECICEGMYPRCSFIMKPANDIIQQIANTENQNILMLIQKIRKYKHVYIYMPTWRINLKDTFLQTAEIDFDKIELVMERQDALFLVKLHPAVKLAQAHQELHHVLFLDKGIDIYPILPFTNTLITDYSSIYYDYLLMENKQVILFPFDINEYRKHADELAFDYDEYTPGKRVYSFNELLATIDDNSEHTVPQRDWVLNMFWGDYHSKADTQLLINKIQSI